MRRFAGKALCSLAVLAAMIGPAPAEPAGGRYGPLSIAIRDGTVRGVFAEGRLGNGTQDAPQFSCLFLIEGPLTGDRARVETWFPGDAEPIAGVLDLGPDPSLQLAENHGGCAMASGDMVAEPYSLVLDEPRGEWIGAGLVTAPRAVLRREPAEELSRTKPYLVEFDPVAVLERRAGWMRVAFLDATERPVTGWLRDDEIAATVATAR